MGAERREEQQAQLLVFTYGILKCGQPNHHILTNRKNGHATLVGTAKTLKKWPLVLVSSYEIPGLLPLEDVGYEVSGEVYLVDDRMLEALDCLESHPDVYIRRPGRRPVAVFAATFLPTLTPKKNRCPEQRLRQRPASG
ncbi:hypothetical protein MTO96_026116 [Rhipicephalus appendiculatus]